MSSDANNVSPPAPGGQTGLFRKKRRRIKVSVALRFYNEILGLDHLHYGLWDGEPLNREGLRSAQDRYAERLASLIPEGVETILDVGCGTGAFSRSLRENGYEIEGLSPDPHQQKLYAERVGRPFHLSRFQDFEPTKTYDLVMMSEVAQYIWLPSFFPAVRRVAPGGHLLLADYFKIEVDGRLPDGSGHPLEAFRAEAEKNGLELFHEEDITDATAPTLELAKKWIEEHVDPALGLAHDAIADRHPWIFRIGRAILARRFKKLIEGREFIDPEVFRKARRYLVLGFRVPG